MHVIFDAVDVDDDVEGHGATIPLVIQTPETASCKWTLFDVETGHQNGRCTIKLNPSRQEHKNSRNVLFISSAIEPTSKRALFALQQRGMRN